MSNRRRDLERQLKEVENRLRGRPASLELTFERSRLLDRLGRLDDARQGYVEILQRDPAHFGALNDLGMLLFRAGQRADALTCFSAAVAKHPHNAIGHANLAFMLLRGGDAAGARAHYETALQLEPENIEAHRGLALALRALGDEEAAQRHGEAGFGAQPVVELPYRGDGEPVRVLLVVSAGPGNVPTDRFLDDRTFAVIKLTAEYVDPAMPLPAHDLVFNAVGDADSSLAALRAAAAIAARSGAPVVNDPTRVLATGRASNARRLAQIGGVVAPRVEAIRREVLLESAGADELARRGFAFPILLRSPGFHAGTNFERIERPEDLAAVAAALPGDELLAIEYLDLRGVDGRYRKYRVMMIGGALYPLHLAISDSWKVHYFSAQMAERAEYRKEEEAFLSDMPAALGARALTALGEVQAMLGLDYAGADFSLDADGNAVVFEANATMTLPSLDADDRWAYRREPVARIEAAARALPRERSRRAR